MFNRQQYNDLNYINLEEENDIFDKKAFIELANEIN